jgi:hypothetical protein
VGKVFRMCPAKPGLPGFALTVVGICSKLFQNELCTLR